MKNTSSDSKIRKKDLYFFRHRQRNRFYYAVLGLFAEKAEKEGLSKKELAESLGKDPAQITRWFSGPGNWNLDTVSDLLLAMGAELDVKVHSISPEESTGKIIHIPAAPTTSTASREATYAFNDSASAC